MNANEAIHSIPYFENPFEGLVPHVKRTSEKIKLNKEKELKEKLFKQTIEQLKQTFEKNDLDKLQNLYFDFELPDNDLIDEEEDEEPTTLGLAEE